MSGAKTNSHFLTACWVTNLLGSEHIHEEKATVHYPKISKNPKLAVRMTYVF